MTSRLRLAAVDDCQPNVVAPLHHCAKMSMSVRPFRPLSILTIVRIRASLPSSGGLRGGGNLDQRRTFTARGQVTVSWKLTSTRGASTSSLRALAIAVGATTGDTLVLAINVRDASLKVARLTPTRHVIRRVQQFLGRTASEPIEALAASLEGRRSEVTTVLQGRGDHGLAALLGRRSRES